MKDFVRRLEEKTAEFGNHHHKYIQTVRRDLDHLIQRLEEQKKRDLVHILHSSYDFGKELKIVAGIAQDTKERLSFIQTFFALHFLLMNRHAIDMLGMLEAKTRGNLSDAEAKILSNALTQLRLNYVESAEASPAEAPAEADSKPEPPPEPPEGDDSPPSSSSST